MRASLVNTLCLCVSVVGRIDMKQNNLCIRVIPCLDTREGRVVKGVQFENLQDAGDPVELAARYLDEGADELVVLDISATLEARRNRLETVRAVRRVLSIPLTVGGGIRTVDDVEALLDAGADKVSLNTAPVFSPGILSDIASRFGRQCTVLALDAARSAPGKWAVYTHSGTKAADSLDALEWATTAVSLGAGEVLLTSRDRDGTRSGYDLDLLNAMTGAVSVPVIASGGAWELSDFVAAARAGATGLLAASVLHFQRSTIKDIKDALKAEGLQVRL